MPAHLRLDWAYLNPGDREVLGKILAKQLAREERKVVRKFWGEDGEANARSEDASSLEHLLSVQQLYAALHLAEKRDRVQQLYAAVHFQ